MAAIASLPAAPLPAVCPAAPTSPCRSEGAPQAVVGDIVGQHGSVVCADEATLADAADLLVVNDRTGAGVVDSEGNVLGAITENDIMQAYASGTSPQLHISDWLKSGQARLPQPMLETMAVTPSTPLIQAAARMRAQAGSEGAFRHMVVRDDSGALVGVLSALDLARALCHTAARDEMMERLGNEPVSEVMKHRAALAVSNTNATLGQVLGQMISSRQNCVLVADGEEAHHTVQGVITPRDAVHAFSEHIPLDTRVGRWLRGLQADWEPRIVKEDAPLLTAASTMAAQSIHHLVVVSRDGCQVVGVVSSSDLAQTIGSAERIVEDISPREDGQEKAAAAA